ncbi:MAG: AraC family transcriptional regulator [Lachnospiraceae bacterium]|nr:AraC family transcriptional regulator [Lachnospiraceae bacterium]
MIDFDYMALSLANLSGIPVRLYREEKFVKLYHFSKFKPDPAIPEEPHIFQNKANVSYYMAPSFLFYGLFRAKDESVSFVLGPVAQMPISRRSARELLISMGEPSSRTVELLNYLRAIPTYPLRTFLQILCTFDYFINDERISPGDLLLDEMDADIPLNIKNALASETDEGNIGNHNTYELEQELLSNIEYGRTDALRQMFQKPPAGRAGIMAQDTLRQQKNLLIVTATLSSRAAIRGGLDVETAFSISDLYIQKAELMNDYNSLTKLSVQMELDFADRVAKLQCGETTRLLVQEVRRYVLSHIDEPITTEQLAEYLGKNRTYLCTEFRRESGMTLNAYFTQIKISEARRLLEITKLPLHTISEKLGYSSQSHFQNVFKKTTGCTPLEYRRRFHSQAEKL